jgi:hypothetical protein
MLDSAQEAVKRLDLEAFIQDNKEAIYKQLEDSDACVSKAPEELNPNAVFIAQSLHLISGVIHVGSNPANFDAAAAWVQDPRGRQQLTSAWVLDPGVHANLTSLLSTLVFLYVVNQGWQDANASGDASKKARWESIYKRAEWFCTK